MRETPETPDLENAGEMWSLNAVLARVLSWGTRLSMIVLAAGLVVALVAGERGDTVMKPDALITALQNGKGAGILGVGIVLLIATPVAREVMAMTLLFRHRERALAWVAFFVLVLVVIALAVGSR
jgi:uncharacterized membrane protein